MRHAKHLKKITSFFQSTFKILRQFKSDEHYAAIVTKTSSKIQYPGSNGLIKASLKTDPSQQSLKAPSRRVVDQSSLLRKVGGGWKSARRDVKNAWGSKRLPALLVATVKCTCHRIPVPKGDRDRGTSSEGESALLPPGIATLKNLWY